MYAQMGVRFEVGNVKIRARWRRRLACRSETSGTAAGEPRPSSTPP